MSNWAGHIKRKVRIGQILDEEKGRKSGSKKNTTGELNQRVKKSIRKIVRKYLLHQKDRYRQARQAVRRYWRNSCKFWRDPDSIARDSDRHGTDGPRPIHPFNNTGIGNPRTPLTGDTLVNQSSPLRYHAQSLPKTPSKKHQGPHFPTSGRQAGKRLYGMVPREQSFSPSASTVFTPSIRDERPTTTFQDSFSSNPFLFQDKDTDSDCLLKPCEEHIATGLAQNTEAAIVVRERPSSADTPSSISHPTLHSHPSTTQQYFPDAVVQQKTHASEERSRSLSSNSVELVPLSNDSTTQSFPLPGQRRLQRSTVSYLQIERPRTMLFEDTITLRKNENGVYRVVEH